MIRLSDPIELERARQAREALTLAKRAIGRGSRPERGADFIRLRDAIEAHRAFPPEVLDEVDAVGRALAFADRGERGNPRGADRLRRWAESTTITLLGGIVVTVRSLPDGGERIEAGSGWTP